MVELFGFPFQRSIIKFGKHITDSPQRRAQVQEIAIWTIIVVVCLGGLIIRAALYGNGYMPWEFIIDSYTEVLLAFSAALFPLVYKLIFGFLPLESLRIKRMTDIERAEYLRETIALRGEGEVAPDGAVASQSSLGVDGAFDSSKLLSHSLKQLTYQSSSSKATADRIFQRSGLYLLIGVMIAASGLLFFYLQTANVATGGLGVGDMAIQLGPRFGILFFIELLAFFFLRQYRSAMDEFKYYEAIQRSREEMIFAFGAYMADSEAAALVGAVSSGKFSSAAPVLGNGQTTEHIEGMKLRGNDLIGLAKLVEGVASLKK